MIEIDFLGVGAMKTATSWLHICLNEHPGIFVPRGKEIDFFSYHFNKGYEWYHSYFQNIQDGQVVGEISPSYLIDPKVPLRVYKWNPKIKLIFLLRNPLERAYSHYCMDLRMGKVGDDIEQEILPFLEQGYYYSLIKKYLDIFPRKQMLISLHEDLKSDPGSWVKNVYSFLGADPAFQPPSLKKMYFQRKPRPKNQEFYTWLYDWKKDLLDKRSGWSKIYYSLNRLGMVDLFHKFIREQSYPKLSMTKANKIIDQYRPDVLELSSLLERDLSKWVEVDPLFAGIEKD